MHDGGCTVLGRKGGGGVGCLETVWSEVFTRE